MGTKYRKKPVEIEAIEWTGTNINEVLDFINEDDRWKEGIDSKYVGGPEIEHTPTLGTLDIPTLEGTMTASPNDWIIRGIKGEIYPCKPDIFQGSYDKVE